MTCKIILYPGVSTEQRYPAEIAGVSAGVSAGVIAGVSTVQRHPGVSTLVCTEQ